MHPLLLAPIRPSVIMEQRQAIRRELMNEGAGDGLACRIAILGGSTTGPLRDALELFLLDNGICPSFFESEYGKWYEDAVFENHELRDFAPQIVYIHTSCVNLQDLPSSTSSPSEAHGLAQREMERLSRCWQGLQDRFHAPIIQNNFDLPAVRLFGNLDASDRRGTVRHIARLNEMLAEEAQSRPLLHIQDIHSLAAWVGLREWHDPSFYALYKIAMASHAIPYLAQNLAAMICAILGKSRKCLVLDLDDTVWGGIVGECGMDGLEMGHETALGESYLSWQKYLLRLRQRGILLAVCSKNDEEAARSGFLHPDCLLKPEDFVSFQANWEPKPKNLRRIAEEANIGIDSLVFIDDSPVERAIVREQLPMVAVPEVLGGEPGSYVAAIEEGRYFEAVSVSEDDLHRNEAYRENRERKALERSSASYEQFLESLAMRAEIAPFREIYLARIAQLTNKTNQFNLTTRRCTEGELRCMANDGNWLTLYGRLADRFGDNGVVSVVAGERIGEKLHIRLWLMSCRVLKRGMEYAMLDRIVDAARAMGCKALVGYYIPTKKNRMVSGLYKDLGFAKLSEEDGSSVWELPTDGYSPRSQFIRIQNEGSRDA